MRPEEAKHTAERLDAISRTRALSENESRLLERAIQIMDEDKAQPVSWGGRRELVRAGIKRKMGVYLRGNRS